MKCSRGTLLTEATQISCPNLWWFVFVKLWGWMPAILMNVRDFPLHATLPLQGDVRWWWYLPSSENVTYPVLSEVVKSKPVPIQANPIPLLYTASLFPHLFPGVSKLRQESCEEQHHIQKGWYTACTPSSLLSQKAFFLATGNSIWYIRAEKLTGNQRHFKWKGRQTFQGQQK